MNENIDLTKILENCPVGWEFWSDNYGKVRFKYINKSYDRPIFVKRTDGGNAYYTKEGWCSKDFPASCLLWPSKDCRDWSKFTAPWYKKEELVKPKFKIGDKIVNIPMKYEGFLDSGTISKITDDKYIFIDGSYTSISSQDSWELVPDKKPKFDPKTLQPYDKVLVRRGNENYNIWFPDFVADPPKNNDNNKTLCMCVGDDIAMVIPYNNDTKHLIGTTDEAPEYYKYWED